MVRLIQTKESNMMVEPRSFIRISDVDYQGIRRTVSYPNLASRIVGINIEGKIEYRNNIIYNNSITVKPYYSSSYYYTVKVLTKNVYAGSTTVTITGKYRVEVKVPNGSMQHIGDYDYTYVAS